MDNQEQLICRPLEIGDYQKGFLQCMSFLTITPELTFHEFETIFQKYQGIVYVVEDIEKQIIVSSASLVKEQNIFGIKYYIENVVTLPQYRGKGLVRQLIQTLTQSAQGNNSIELFCKEETSTLYKKFGFIENAKLAVKYI